MKKPHFPAVCDPSFYRMFDVSNLTRKTLIKADKLGMRPVFGFAVSGVLHRVVHLLKDEDYLLTEGEDPQQERPLYVSITDRKSLSRLPAAVLNRENLLKKHFTYYEGNMVPSTWAQAIAGKGNITAIYPRELSADAVVEGGLLQALAHAGELHKLDVRGFVNHVFSVVGEVEKFASDKAQRDNPDIADLWRSAFDWLAKLFVEARSQIK